MSANIPKITLHWLEVSRSHRILWLLEELRIPYELKTWKRGADRRADPHLKDIHPLGKSPIVTIDRKDDSRGPLVLIESAAIAEYLCDHFGTWLIPQRYPQGKEGQIAAETEEWLRYRTYMHYAEGSLMPLNLVFLLNAMMKSSSENVEDRVTSWFLKPNYETHYNFLESQLESSTGPYLCGKDLTAADILMSFPLEAGQSRSGMTKEQCPRLWEYVASLHKREAYQRSVQKIREVEGTFKTHL